MNTPSLLHADGNSRLVYGDLLLSLIPCVIAAMWLFGWRSVALIIICVGAAVAAETLYCALRRRRNTAGDLKSILIGAVFALMLPASLPPWEAALGIAVPIFLGRFLEDLSGRRWFHPAALGYVLLAGAFYKDMALPSPIAFNGIGASDPTLLQLILGIRPEGIGTACLPALLLGGAYLLSRHILHPFSLLIAMSATAIGWGLLEKSLYNLSVEWLSGGFLFMMIFLFSDPLCGARSREGKHSLALLFGALTVLARYFLPLSGTALAFVVVGALAPLTDLFVYPLAFGRAPRQKNGKKTKKSENRA